MEDGERYGKKIFEESSHAVVYKETEDLRKGLLFFREDIKALGFSSEKPTTREL